MRLFGTRSPSLWKFCLQSRAIGPALLVGGIVLAILAAKVNETWKVIQLSNSVDKAEPLHFNAAASDISSATAHPTATGMVFETVSGDSGMQFSVPNIPTSAATSTINTAMLITGGVVSTATDSANGQKPGDYVFDFKDPDDWTWLQNKAQSSATCNNNKVKRDGFGCAPLAAMDAMAALEGPLANLLLIGPAQLPRFATNTRNGDLVRAVNTVFTTGRNVAALVNIPDPVLWVLAEMFLYFFDEAINHAIAWADEYFIPQSDLDVSSTSTTTTTTGGPCPTGKDQPACEDADCNEVNSVATCTTPGPNSKCSCAPLITPFVNSIDAAWLFGQQTILSSLVSMANKEPPPKPIPSCNNDGPAHLEQGWAIGEVSMFCDENFQKLVTPNAPVTQNFAD